ncbi:MULTISPECIES: flavin reductase family protein [unclassified Novosphingobium]|uniref:flavin reductase family protein n=1 Tax=unclassified Novosphingobium TaxID=2644732 RepID=UPI00135B3A60|nr:MULTISPECIES: flavin reductase family protein [unclassified Novosphingobium]
MSTPNVKEAAQPVLDDFRHAMRRVAGGVALVTTADGEGNRYGIAMTAFMSLSFEPPSLVMAVNRTASIHAPLLCIGAFCVNVLAADQEALCRDFAARPSRDRFGVGEWLADSGGIPYLRGAQANIFCTLDSHQPSGSHDVIVGLASAVFNHDEIKPLIFVDGRYGAMA